MHSCVGTTAVLYKELSSRAMLYYCGKFLLLPIKNVEGCSTLDEHSRVLISVGIQEPSFYTH